VKIFLSSTFRDLIRARKAVLDALQQRQQTLSQNQLSSGPGSGTSASATGGGGGGGGRTATGF